MNPLGYICIFIGLICLATIWLTHNRIKRRKMLQSCLFGIQSLLFLSLFLCVLLLFSNLNTYSRLTAEKVVAEILVEELTEQQYQLEINLGDNSVKTFLINGDEWQLDVRIIKWKGWANLIGLDSFYQLDRITGRYKDINLANTKQSTAYKILKEERGLSLWDMKKMVGEKLAFFDTYFGQGVFMPMRHLARYTVLITQSGLVVRPANKVANQALEAW